ncbi:hypothetical protein BZG36_02049 [Bifiguratus adelaidae]|uniref:Uncharacterized protein n=1 Tax=Bifiguratus adelaidae TaxID=1938954 RepID=A0A261Y1Y3_9FUNG|nr:hypothetical protein BZG36_02049 [Bifiguratus adelaidae]
MDKSTWYSTEDHIPLHTSYRSSEPFEALDKVPEDPAELWRMPDYCKIVTRSDVLNRAVPYYELWITNCIILGWHVLSKSAENSAHSATIVLFQGCSPDYYMGSTHSSSGLDNNFNLCSTVLLLWVLVGGAVIYAILSSIAAIILWRQLVSRGYPPKFTALWHSPAFVVTYFMSESQCVDILSLPATYHHLNSTKYFHKCLLSIYSILSVCALVAVLAMNTPDQADMVSQPGYNDQTPLQKFWNPYLIQYYAAVYFYTRCAVMTALEVFWDKGNVESPELIAIHESALKAM